MFFVTGCSKDNPDNPSNSVPDPEGTITILMSNSGARYNTLGGIETGELVGFGNPYFAISVSNNFVCHACTIANVGKVSGLGSIVKIPSSGFASQIAVEPGCGYVINIQDETYVRLYVVKWETDTSGGVMGATVKYQYPFVP